MPKVFDDKRSIIHILAGVMVGALHGTAGAILAIIFVGYELFESRSTEEFLADFFEFFWGYFIYTLLH